MCVVPFHFEASLQTIIWVPGDPGGKEWERKEEGGGRKEWERRVGNIFTVHMLLVHNLVHANGGRLSVCILACDSTMLCVYEIVMKSAYNVHMYPFWSENNIHG